MDLGQVLNASGHLLGGAGEIDFELLMELQFEGYGLERGLPDMRQVVEVVQSQCAEAMAVLLPHQQRRLRQVALQWLVESRDVRFPLRLEIVHQPLRLSANQQQRIEEELAEHDERYSQLINRYREQFDGAQHEAQADAVQVLQPGHVRLGQPDLQNSRLKRMQLRSCSRASGSV